MKKIVFEITDQFHKKIRLTEGRFNHIMERPEMKAAKENIKSALLIPFAIKESKHDQKVWLYYSSFKKTPVTRKYLTVIVKLLDHEGFIITSYYTNKIKEGKTIWQR